MGLFSCFFERSEEQHILIHNKTILSSSEWIELNEASIIPRTDDSLIDWIVDHKVVAEPDRYGGRAHNYLLLVILPPIRVGS